MNKEIEILKEKLNEAFEYLKSKGIIHNKKEFAGLIDTDYTNLSSAFNGSKRHLTEGLFQKICSTNEAFNLAYFINDEGLMINDEYDKNDADEYLPLIPFDFIAGFGEDNEGIGLYKCERYNIPEFKNIGAEFLVRVGGSSMYPKYSSGDILACKKIHDILFFQWGKVYVIDSSQGQLVKRICKHDNDDMVWLVSDNKEKYDPFPIPKSDIRSLSIVLGAVRME